MVAPAPVPVAPEVKSPRAPVDVNPLFLQGHGDFRGILNRHFRREDRAIARAQDQLTTAAMGMVMVDGAGANPYQPLSAARYEGLDSQARNNLKSELAALRANLLPQVLATNVRTMANRFTTLQSELEARASGDFKSFAFPPEYFSSLAGSDVPFAADHAMLSIFASEGTSVAGRSFQRAGAAVPGYAIAGTTEQYRQTVQRLLARLPATYVPEPTGLVDRGTLTVAGVRFELVREEGPADAAVPAFGQSVEQMIQDAMQYEPVLAAREQAAVAAQALPGLYSRLSDLKSMRRSARSQGNDRRVDRFDRRISQLNEQIRRLGRG